LKAFKELFENSVDACRETTNAVVDSANIWAINVHIQLQDEGKLRLSVQDNGIGFDTIEMCRFFRSSKATNGWGQQMGKYGIGLPALISYAQVFLCAD